MFSKTAHKPIGKGDMLKDILSSIENAYFCIFDLTGYNPSPERFPHNLNSILELGMSLGLRKPTYVTWKEGAIDWTCMSDLQQAIAWRFTYKNNKELEEGLREIVAQMQNEIG